MRQIKFRGLRTDGTGWVYGDLATYMDGSPMIMPKCYFATRDFDEEDEDGTPVIQDDMALGGFFAVIPETVGQFITNNGNQDFYIGDVVINPKGRKHTVVIWDNLPCLHYSEKGRDFYSPMTNGFLANKKVIGSIHTTHDKGKEE